MRQFGNTFGDLPEGLGQAEQSMRGAVDNLQNQDFGGAAENQNNALSQLQQGLQSAQQMMQRQAGQVPGPGQRSKMDPLGRPTDEDSEGSAIDNSSVGIPDEPTLERARRIFDELRQRRNDPTRPRQERDYLDRLLKQF
jgi:hypothetical protein